MTCQVLIVGGGSAGLAAAVGASRSGAATTLVEREEFLGGMATGAMVGTVCGLHLRSEQHCRAVSEGFPRAFGDRLARLSGTEPMVWKEGLRFLPYLPASFADLCSALVEEEGINLLCGASIAGCAVDGDTIRSVSLADSAATRLSADTIVDCTGNAVVTALSGGRVIAPERRQASAIVFTMSGIKVMDPHVLRMMILRDVKRAARNGNGDAACERLSMVPGSCRDDCASFKLGLPIDCDDLDRVGRERVDSVVGFLTSGVAAFDQATLTSIAPLVGVRSGNRPWGRDRLTTEQVLGAMKCDDGVARGAWPVEFWDDRPGPQMTYFAADDYYEIPAGALRSSDFVNLYFAGKSFAASDDAIASARVIGTCLATGYAAGRMAACASIGRPQEEAVRGLRSELATVEEAG